MIAGGQNSVAFYQENNGEPGLQTTDQFLGAQDTPDDPEAAATKYSFVFLPEVGSDTSRTYYARLDGAVVSLDQPFGGTAPFPGVDVYDQFPWWRNDSSGDAHPYGYIGTRTETGLSLDSAADQDYFSVVPPAGGTIHVDLSFPDWVLADDITVVVIGHDEEGTYRELARSPAEGATGPGPRSVVVNAVKDERYVIHVFSPHGRPVPSYDLRIERVGPAVVIDKDLVYKNSALDGHDTTPGVVSPDARAWRAAMPADFAGSHFNFITGYDKGINALFVDVSNLPPVGEGGVEVLSPADFRFRVGTGGDPSAWRAAPAPTGFAVHRGAGMHESDRVVFTWPDRAITNTWMQVTTLATGRTGLAAPEVFSFGNLVGDTGTFRRADELDFTRTVRVDGADSAAVRANFARDTGPPEQQYANRYDHNRDRAVNVLDLMITQRNLARSLRPVTAPPPAVAASPTRPAPAIRSGYRPAAASAATAATATLFAESPILG
jgi:hypothetical protein